ncbi:MAG: hypothetical protein RhofKO_35500 [Rhodothermales bacterium]
MEMLHTVSLWIHVAAGMTALFVAPGAMIARKGKTWHRRWGKIYFWCMFVVAVSAVVMASVKPNLFLLLLAVFSFYLSFSGYRVLYRKKPGATVPMLDWIVTGGTVIASMGMGIYGATVLMGGESFGAVMMVFGILGTWGAGQDLYQFVRPPKSKQAWFFKHMNGFLASYIATVSAFSAVNFFFLPPVVRWLWPTVLGTIGIAVWARHYRKTFNRKPSVPSPNGTSAVAHPSLASRPTA